MNSKITNAIKFFSFWMIVLFLVLYLDDIFIKNNTSDTQFQGPTYTVNGIYELPKNSIDVLFLGDSSIEREISPMELWNEYGISSYNYGITSARMYTLYYILQDVLRYQKPELVVLDPVTLFYKYEPNEAVMRISGDYLDNTIIKYNMVNDEHFNNTFEDKVSYFLPLLRYHSRWSELKGSDFVKLGKRFYSKTRGYLMSYAIDPNVKGYAYMDKVNKKIAFENDGDIYLLKIKEICDKNNIKLLMLGLEDATTWNKSSSELLASFCDEHGIELYDLNLLRYGIDWNTDTKDKGSHMNVFGALKATKVVGEYLDSHYTLKDHRNDESYSFWNDDYKEYKKELERYKNKANEKIKKMAINKESSLVK